MFFSFFNSYRYYTHFIPVAELVITIGITTKAAKAEMETHPVIVEIAISE